MTRSVLDVATPGEKYCFLTGSACFSGEKLSTFVKNDNDAKRIFADPFRSAHGSINMDLSDLNDALSPATLEERLAIAAHLPGRVVFTTSFGLEDQAITHAIHASGAAIDILTLDTGRLFPETYEVWARHGAALWKPDRGAYARDGRNSSATWRRTASTASATPSSFAKRAAASARSSRSDARSPARSAGSRACAPSNPIAAAARLSPRSTRPSASSSSIRSRTGGAASSRPTCALHQVPYNAAARPRLSVDRLRPLHPRRPHRRARARGALVVGGGRQEGMRPALAPCCRSFVANPVPSW